jgi:hypothetical protein
LACHSLGIFSLTLIVFQVIIWKPLLSALILPAKTCSLLKCPVKSPTKNVLDAERGIRQQPQNVELRRGGDQTAVSTQPSYQDHN